MKYLVATFKIETEEGLMQTCRDLLADSAAEAGFESFEDIDSGLMAYVQKDMYNKEVLDESISNFPIANAHIVYDIQEAEDKDWNQEWESQGFDPICIDGKIVIFDAKHPNVELTEANNTIKIGIEAQLAFGTGNHETTRMIVSTLLGMNLAKKRVLDCGTGTGILGIVCSKLGASEIVGYDIDEWSVNNAQHNAKLNDVGNMEVMFGNASVINHINGMFDIVLANINRNILLADMNAFRSVLNEGGYLILSGFYEDDIPLLMAKAEEQGMRMVGKKTDQQWACISLSTL